MTRAEHDAAEQAAWNAAQTAVRHARRATQAADTGDLAGALHHIRQADIHADDATHKAWPFLELARPPKAAR